MRPLIAPLTEHDMTNLTPTQTQILSRAASRPGNIALPLPPGLAGAAAKMAVGKMVERGWLEEAPANAQRGEPIWRELGDGQGTTLVATEAGLEAIGIDRLAARAAARARKAKPELEHKVDAPKPVAVRPGTKQALVIALLKRPEGATVAEIVERTGWLPHTVRGMISGALKKKLGLAVGSEAVEGRGMVYKLRVNALPHL